MSRVKVVDEARSEAVAALAEKVADSISLSPLFLSKDDGAVVQALNRSFQLLGLTKCVVIRKEVR